MWMVGRARLGWWCCVNQLFDRIQSREDVHWRAGQFEDARGFARSGLVRLVREIQREPKEALRRVHVGSFPQLSERLASNHPEYLENAFLREAVERLKSGPEWFPLYYAAADSEMCDFSDRMAMHCVKMIQGGKGDELKPFFVLYGFNVDFMGEDNWEPRVGDPMFWRRQVRKLCGRKVEQVAREIGLTHKKAGCYVSEFTFQRWLSAQRRNQEVIKGLEAENDLGQVFGLDDLAGLGVSDNEIRRGELMVRMRGFEEWADRQPGFWQPIFVTLTNPSRFHSHTLVSDGKAVVVNSRYDGSTPRDAMDWHNKRLARMRSRLHRKVKYFGFRIVEPHHDGCPHIHAVYFVQSDWVGAFMNVVDLLWREEPERGDENRVVFELIDREAGSATGYIAKYVSKNIDGFAVGRDHEAGAYAEATAARVRAWASIWGIRQFQQQGGPPVSVWRELRRLANQPEHMPPEHARSEQLEMAFFSADEGDWCGFVDAMGGAVCDRECRPISLFWCDRDDTGRYGDTVRFIRGLWSWCFQYPLLTRVREWAIRFKKKEIAPRLDSVRSQIRDEARRWAAVMQAPGPALDLCQ
jgi:hypothetical protein